MKILPHKKKKGLKNSCFRCIVELCEHFGSLIVPLHGSTEQALVVFKVKK